MWICGDYGREGMSESKFEILTSTEAVIEKLKDYLQEEIVSIKVYCKNFGLYTQETFKNPHFKTPFYNTSLSFQVFCVLEEYRRSNLDKQEGFIEIHTSQALTESNILDKINHQQKTKDVFFLSGSHNLIKVTASSQHLDIFVDFLKKLIDQIPSAKRPKTFKSISRIAELFLKHADKQEEALNDALNFLKEKIVKKANELKSKEGFDFNIQEEINNSFKNLTTKINKIKEEQNLTSWKAILIFFVEIFPSLFEEPNLSSYKDILETIERLYNSSTEFFYDQYKYTYLTPLFQLLATDIAPVLALLAQTTLKEEIQLESKSAFYFLDYSHFNTSEQNHPLYFHLSYAIARCLEKIPSECEEYAIYSLKTQENIHSDFELLSKLDNRRISLFFSPYFNSYKVTKWLKEQEKQNAQKSQTSEGKNYLILSQCPQKSNAGLSEWLIQELGYEVKDNINRTAQPPKLSQKPKDTHNPLVDYSKYEIKINAKDNAPFVLSLSPFAFISKKSIPKYEESFWSSIPFYKSHDEKQRSALYIESFFRQESELDEFFKKEEEKYLQVIDRIRNFAKSLCEQKYHTQPQYLEPQTTRYQTCKILEVLSLILLLKTIEENYNNVSLSDHSLKINDDEVVFFSQETFFSLRDKHINQIAEDEHPHTLKQRGELIPIYISSSSNTSLSLEYFANKLKEEKEIQRQELHKKIYSIIFDTQEHKEEDIKLEYGELFLGFTQTFIDAFAFSFVLQDSQNLAPKLLNAILDSPYASELIKQFDATFKIKELCTLSSNNQKRLYQLLSSQAQKYDNISLDRELDIEKMLMEALDEVAKEIPQAFIDVMKSGAFLDPKKALIDFFASLLGAFTHSIFISLAKSINTEFENQKKAFKTLLYSDFTDKNNAPLALKREEGVYYPIAINQTSFNFSFSNYILGGKLCSGGMGELDTNFYILNTFGSITVSKINTLDKIRNLHLGILFMLLCLDEIRNGEIGERVEDESFFKQDHSRKKFRNYVLDLEKDQDLILYESYSGGSKKKAQSQGEAIKSYQIIMQYLDDIQAGVFDSISDKNTPNPKRHREAIRALDNIGKNNIRGLYVGIKDVEKDKNNQEQEKEIKQPRPKLIGRLATTIIMKDGLWIG